MKFKDLFNFDKMLTPLIIKIIYYIGICCSAIGGIAMFFGGIGRAFKNGGGFFSVFGNIIGGMLGGVLIIVLGVLLARIFAELLIVLFQIHRNLTAIKKKLVDDEIVVDDAQVVDDMNIVDNVKVVVEEKPLTE